MKRYLAEVSLLAPEPSLLPAPLLGPRLTSVFLFFYAGAPTLCVSFSLPPCAVAFKGKRVHCHPLRCFPFTQQMRTACRRRLVLPTHTSTHRGAHLLIWPLWCEKTSFVKRFPSPLSLSLSLFLSLLLVFVSSCLIRV